MAKHRIGKAQKRKRRNKQRHAWRMGRTPFQKATDAAVGRGPRRQDPSQGIFENVLPMLTAILATRKYRRKGEKKDSEAKES